MFLKKRIRKYSAGFTFIESITFILIFVLIVVTFYNVIAVGTRAIVSSKNRLGAVALANEKMEIARNLKYDDVGTVGGVCSGIIQQDENITENGKTYHVYTYASFVDDDTDGVLSGTPNDLAFHDYKKLEIIVSWDNGGTDHGSVKTVSRFVPPGLEVATVGDGILVINVFSDQDGGAPVAGANVHVVNSDVGIDEVIQTDAAGNVTLIGAKESQQKYQITVSKSGYETVNNFAPYPITSYNPVDVFASVMAATLNTTSMIENKVANMKISTVDYLGNAVGDVGIALKGGRKLGSEFEAPFNPVYNFSFDGKTDSGGEKTFTSISPGQYTFGLSSSETAYTLIGIDPTSPFPLPSDSATDLKLKVAAKTMTGLLARVINSADSSPVVGATVELKNNGFAYDETITTGADGMAFFPNSNAAVFQAGTYDLSVQATDFQSESSSETIDDGSLMVKDVSMTENL